MLREAASSVAIVVSSCDTFFDAWRLFGHFFQRFWPECPLQVHLIVNELTVRSDWIVPLAVGPDRGWASNMRAALNRIEHSHILYFQEDYFLTAPVREDLLASDFETALAQNADAFCLRARSAVEPRFEHIDGRFGVVPRDSDGRTRLQVTLWKRSSLLQVLRDGDSAWQMEWHGSDRTREMKILSYSTREEVAVPYLMSAIVRGLWSPDALTLCSDHGVLPSPWFRGTYTRNSLLRGWRRAITRWRGQKALSGMKGRVVDLLAAPPPAP